MLAAQSPLELHCVQAAADDVRALVSQERVLESTMHLGCLRERREAGAAAATSQF